MTYAFEPDGTNVGSEAKLKVLKDLGFIFRIPGGAGRKGTHTSLGIIPRYYNNSIWILVVPYNPKIVIERRYEEMFDEAPEGTLELKILEQTGVRVSEYDQIGMQEAKNNRVEVNALKHNKYLYYVSNFDDTNIRQEATPDKRIDPALWVEIELLKEYLCPQHQWCLTTFDHVILEPRLRDE